MHRLNWVTVILILLTGIIFFVFLSNRYTVGKNWETKIDGQRKQIESKTAEIEKLKKEIYGTPLKSGEEWVWSRMGLIAKSDKLDSLVPGKVWTYALPDIITSKDDAPELELVFTVQPGEGGARLNGNTKVGEKDLVYIFDKGIPFPQEMAGGPDDAAPAPEPAEAAEPEPAKFLGVFTVKQIVGVEDAVAQGMNAEEAAGHEGTYSYVVKSVGVVDEEQRRLIADSVKAERAWIVYEGLLPIDSPNDIACWLEEYPDSPFSKTLKDEDRAFFQKTTYGSADDLEAFSAALAEAKDDRSFQSFAEPPEGKRYPDRYDTKLLREYYQRDKLRVMTARGESSKDDLDRVISDQLAMIGCGAVPGTDSGDADPDLLEKFNGLGEKDRAEFEEKSAALLDAYRNIGAEGLERIASLLPAAQNGFESQTFFDQKQEAVEKLRLMESQRDIVESRLATAQDAVVQIQDRIRFLVGENAQLARSIAEAQFEAADAIAERANSITASLP